MSTAELMPNLQAGVESTNTLYTKYEEVMKYDGKMRALVFERRPPFLCATLVAATWPCYTPWARRAAAISSSDKIIMIHPTLRCVKQPKGPDVTINWDDSTRYSLKRRPGLTAFMSNSQLYGLLSEEEQRMADHSWVEYWPHQEHKIEEIGDSEESKVNKSRKATSPCGTTMEFLEKYGPRTMHQANIDASLGPVGPVPIPVAYITV
ncbi:hypothetical protein LTR36_005022 [Oleoguttula mirabilis]|uniref:Uncharacterized protein n=1 Tax=Oleoguttula mirabilis TaxID=1507867 RepID=A0AAV9JVT8_9PEZI|nr:hypothetical protein LTR36_005022 [Oleoguttula mirabilis]